MLIESLNNLALAAGAERLSLELIPDEGGLVVVTLVTSLSNNWEPEEETTQQQRARKALSKPLSSSYFAAEADRKIVASLDALQNDVGLVAAIIPKLDEDAKRSALKGALADVTEADDESVTTDSNITSAHP